MPPRPQSVASSSQLSPQTEASLQQSSDPLAAEREWHQGIVIEGLSWPRNPNTATMAITSTSAVQKTDTPQSTSSVPKTDTAQSQSPATKTPTSQPQQSTTQAQASAPSSSSKLGQSKSQGSKKDQNQIQKPSKTAPVIEMRVAIVDKAKSLVVGTSTSAEVLDARGKVLGKLSANDGTNVQPDGSNIRIGKWKTQARVSIKPAKGGLVFVGDRWYRGHLLLVSQGNSLLAVNYVDLESYISSVVGCEVDPSWPMDALKAQAIAARSYALVHYIRPANPLYNLGNTQRWQVYRGISSEWNTTHQAASETKGVFLSYKGGVVESMYAASDDIVANVFGGKGMSQNGALSLAQKGYNYQQILSNYYPGTNLAWMDTKAADAE